MPVQKKRQIRKFYQNNVVILLTTSDIFVWGSYFVLNILAGLYLEEALGQDAIRIVGTGTGIYFISRAIFQLPLGIITDRLKSDKDEIFILFLASFFIGIPYMLYPTIKTESFYYLLQAVIGLGSSLNLNTWRKLFAKNIDKNEEGREYGFYETLMSISSAILVTVGGIVANISKEWFDAVIFGVGIITILGGLFGGCIILVKDRKSK